MTFRITSANQLTESLLDTLYDLEQRVFPKPLPREVLHQKLNGARSLLILIAYVDDDAVGYKVGFEHVSDSDYFYSWIGGVVPESRKHGIASRLMVRQHALVGELGYRYIQTKTKNRYREMLRLNIKHGFDVMGVTKKLKEVEHTIIMEKSL